MSVLRPCVDISIIGSAGRRHDKDKMTSQLYNAAIDKTMGTIREKLKIVNTRHVRLVSGGAAWSDHIAVHLFLHNEVSRLLLHFPAKWIQKPKPHFEDNGKSDQNNPGKMANIYHRHFSKTTGIDSLMQIQQAIQIGAYFKVHNGFQERNKHVAMSSKLIAFTWGKGDRPKPGGTLNTWRLCKGRRIHVPYASLTCICTTFTKASRETGEKRKLTKTSDCLSTRPSKVTLNDAEDDNEKYVKEFEGFDMFSDLIDTN